MKPGDIVTTEMPRAQGSTKPGIINDYDNFTTVVLKEGEVGLVVSMADRLIGDPPHITIWEAFIVTSRGEIGWFTVDTLKRLRPKKR